MDLLTKLSSSVAIESTSPSNRKLVLSKDLAEIDSTLKAISQSPDFYVDDRVSALLLDDVFAESVNRFSFDRVLEEKETLEEANKRLISFQSLASTCRAWKKTKDSGLLSFPFVYCKAFLQDTEFVDLKSKVQKIGQETKDLLDLTKDRTVSLKDVKKQVSSFDSAIRQLEDVIASSSSEQIESS